MAYAIVKTGGKQYRVEPGQSLLVEKLEGDESDTVQLEPVLFRSDDVLFGADALKEVKVFAGQAVTGGEIIVRQRGTRFKPGDGVGIGRDDTLYARSAGLVQCKAGRRGRVVSVSQPESG